MKKKWLTAGIVAVAIIATVITAVVTGPKSDFEQAVADARKSNKHLLIYFNGSDWCSWCKKLDAEVFNTPEFGVYARENLICLQANFPKRNLQSEDKKRENEELARKYSVSAVPTIVLLDAKGEWIGTTGYRPGGPDGYLQHLTKIMSDYRNEGTVYTNTIDSAKYKQTQEKL
jgi:thioredoxin-related protein